MKRRKGWPKDSQWYIKKTKGNLGLSICDNKM